MNRREKHIKLFNEIVPRIERAIETLGAFDQRYNLIKVKIPSWTSKPEQIEICYRPTDWVSHSLYVVMRFSKADKSYITFFFNESAQKTLTKVQTIATMLFEKQEGR